MWQIVPRLILACSLALACLLLGTGCSAPPASQGGFSSNNPASLVYAIHRAGEEKDKTKLPQLVTALENDDPAVRMMAIYALEQITGKRLGYDPYAPPDERAVAVERWEQTIRTKNQPT